MRSQRPSIAAHRSIKQQAASKFTVNPPPPQQQSHKYKHTKKSTVKAKANAKAKAKADAKAKQKLCGSQHKNGMQAAEEEERVS